MSNDAYPDAFLSDILLTMRTIAMVGASDKETTAFLCRFRLYYTRGATV
jgi:predicted CoA-binding protein